MGRHWKGTTDWAMSDDDDSHDKDKERRCQIMFHSVESINKGDADIKHITMNAMRSA